MWIIGKKEYELVGKYVEKYIEIYLSKKFNLTTLYVPNKKKYFIKKDETQPQCKILVTQNFPINPKCLIIIQGSGNVKLGQWARSVCINDNLYLGSMIPYIDKAIKNNYSVIILNPNERIDFLDERKIIEEFSTNENHCLYVYSNIIKSNINIKEIYIVAHSYGGNCTIEILLKNKEDLISGRIKKIAFTDSAHGNKYKLLDKNSIHFLKKISRNYICSQLPVGSFMGYQPMCGVYCYSAGHIKHEYTSGCAIEEIFHFFKKNQYCEFC